MITLDTIRTELEDIRYYYSRKDAFEKACGEIGANTILETIRRYNQAICHASPRLYEIYVALYVNCSTYEIAAEELGFSISHIYKTNRKIVSFFFDTFNQEVAA